MASPSAKYSNSASITTSASPSARMAVEPHNTRPTTNGISTAAVTTRFHVIERKSPANSQASSHHIEGNKSRGTNILQVWYWVRLCDFHDKSLSRGQELSRRASEERGYKFFLILRRVCWPLSRGSYFI